MAEAKNKPQTRGLPRKLSKKTVKTKPRVPKKVQGLVPNINRKINTSMIAPKGTPAMSTLSANTTGNYGPRTARSSRRF